MGYRLEIYKSEYTGCCLGKLYGYIADEELEKLHSYKWLKDNDYIDGNEYWCYGFEGNFHLSKEQFKEFYKLYKEDWKNVYDIELKKEDIDKLIEDSNCYSDFILNWG